jgi:hypothetical protein
VSFPALLQSALRAGWLRAALVALLLFAQHGALTHALSHMAVHGGEGTAHVHAQHDSHDSHGHHDEGPAETAAESCAFDLLYSEVLGGVPAGQFAGFSAAVRTSLVVAAVLAHGAAVFVPYDSRGPPVIS